METGRQKSNAIMFISFNKKRVVFRDCIVRRERTISQVNGAGGTGGRRSQ